MNTADVVIILHEAKLKGDGFSFDIVARESIADELIKKFVEDDWEFYEVSCRIVDDFIGENNGYKYIGSEDFFHISSVNMGVLSGLVEFVKYCVGRGFELEVVIRD